MESSRTCKAVIFDAVHSIRYGDVPMPTIQDPSDAVLRMVVCGVCGSDLHPFHGREPCAPGTVFGHECVGEIVALGTDVEGFCIGDRVVVPFTVACGNCFYCKRQLSARCSNAQLLGWRNDKGEGLHGAQSEYVRIPCATGTMYKCPADFTAEESLLLGDILSTALYAACQAGLAGWDLSGDAVSSVLKLASGDHSVPCTPCTSNEIYAVVGCGPVGLLTIAVSRALLMLRGVPTDDILIYAVDTVPARLEAAERWGATPLKLKSPHDEDSNGLTVQEIEDTLCAASRERQRSGQGVDAVMECVGTSSALELAFNITCPGGSVSSIGVHSGQFPFTPSDAYDKNITYRSGRCPARSLMPASEFILRWLRDTEATVSTSNQGVRLTDIITHKMKLSDACNLYEIFDKKLDGCLKPVMYPS